MAYEVTTISWSQTALMPIKATRPTRLALRSRIEALAEEWKYYCKFDEDGSFEEAGFFARRLRDILKEPKG